MSLDTRDGNGTGCNSHDGSRALKLATPIVSPEELDELGCTVRHHTLCASAGFEIAVESFYCYIISNNAFSNSSGWLSLLGSLSLTLRTAPDDTTTIRDCDALSFSRSKWVR